MPKAIAIDDLVRTNIRELEPYKSARDQFEQGVLLDANENSIGPPFAQAEGLNRYPSPNQETLRNALAEFRNVRAENVFTGVGSDEAIDLLVRIFCEPGRDRILITPPTYGMYKVTAHIHDVYVDQAPLDSDFQLDAATVLDAVKKQTKMIFLCSPNNPTGNLLSKEAIKQILSSFTGIVVVDEAYIDFSDRPSLATEIASYPNLAVLQTMSKAFGMAGIRLGIALSSEDVINYMMKIKAPYNVNSLTARYGLRALKHLENVQFNIEKIVEERERLARALSMLSPVERVYFSDANFILFKIKEAQSVYEKLADRDIIIRYRGNEPGCENCLRVSVGTPDENDRFLSALKEIAS